MIWLSVYFPQVKAVPVATATGLHEYSLPADFVLMVRVEWPMGREPEEFLERVNRAESAGPYSTGVYEVMPPSALMAQVNHTHDFIEMRLVERTIRSPHLAWNSCPKWL